MIQVIRNLCRAVLGATLFLLPWGAAAQSVAVPPPPNSQAISQTGLLPMFAIDLQIDSSWVDGIGAPSQSSQFRHNGVNDTLQQIWESLSSGGFNMIRFPISVDDPQSAVRLANLCTWAKANNVTLIPILQSAATGRNDQPTLSDTLKAFVPAVVSLTRQQDSSLATYTQIGYYQ